MSSPLRTMRGCASECAVCGCTRAVDKWHDRICWCDSCCDTGCSPRRCRALGKPICRYGTSCYRKNPVHWAEYDHPDHPWLRPVCRYGTACYRKNEMHWAEYDHPGHPWLDDFASDYQASEGNEEEDAFKLAIGAPTTACEECDQTLTSNSLDSWTDQQKENDVVSRPDNDHCQVHHTLKVTFKKDTRRLRAQWCCDDSIEQMLASILEVVEEGFNLEGDSLQMKAYVLKYYDEDGDMCTLVKHTVVDFLEIAKQKGSLKLMLEEVLDSPHAGVCEQMESFRHRHEPSNFSLATPPTSPRFAREEVATVGTIEDDYDSAWSLVDA